MAIPRGYEPLRKKNGKAPWIWILILIGACAFGFYNRRQIILLFARDQNIRAEKAKEKLIEQWKTQKITDQSLDDLWNQAQILSEKDPLGPLGYHLLSRQAFLTLERQGVVFDTQSLVFALGGSFQEFAGETQLTAESFDRIYWNAKKSQALTQGDFVDEENNQVLLFLGDTFRNTKKPEARLVDYGKIPLDRLSPELETTFLWLKFYNTMQAGDAKGLEELIEFIKKPEHSGKIHFSVREETFLRGIAKFYKKDYVSSLVFLRQAKTDQLDKITESSISMEGTIFLRQNLPQKAVEVLEEAYLRSGRKNEILYEDLQKILAEKPNLKSKIEKRPEEKK